METWAAKEARERNLTVAEMRILRRICGVTKQDRIRNEKTTPKTKVAEISNRVQKKAKTICTCDEKREEDYVRKRVLKYISVQGNKSRGHAMVGQRESRSMGEGTVGGRSALPGMGGGGGGRMSQHIKNMP